jgi:TatD DNase family protein
MVKNMLSYTDTHAHLSMLSRRGIDAAPLLAKLEAGGFGSILDVGTESGDLRGRIEAFGGFPFVRFSAGIWPGEDAIRDRESRLSALRRSISEAEPGRLVAVGECGIDRHWNRPDQGADAEGELELFLAQAQLALELDLPLIVHSRDAAAETAAAIGEVPGVRGVIHCFSYGVEEARRFLDSGFCSSFAGTLTYRAASALREAARFVPEDRLLLETDCPYLAPLPFRGKAAEPGMIEKTYEAAAAVRGASAAELSDLVAENARRLFGLPTRAP